MAKTLAAKLPRLANCWGEEYQERSQDTKGSLRPGDTGNEVRSSVTPTIRITYGAGIPSHNAS